MKVDKIIVSLYFKNHDVLRIKCSPFLLAAVFITTLAASALFVYKLSTSTPYLGLKVMQETILKEKKVTAIPPAVKLQEKLPVKFKKLDLISTDQGLKVNFFLTKAVKENKSLFRGKLYAEIVSSTGVIGKNMKGEISFAFKNGRPTELFFPNYKLGPSDNIVIYINLNGLGKYQEKIKI